MQRGDKACSSPLILDALHEFVRAADRVCARFPRRIDGGNDNLIRLAERSRKVFHEVPGAGVLVRLEYDERPPGRVSVPARVDRGADFGRVVGVIIDQRYAAGGTAKRHAPLHSIEPGQRILNGGDVRTGIVGDRDRRQGVGHVVPTGNREARVEVENTAA